MSNGPVGDEKRLDSDLGSGDIAVNTPSNGRVGAKGDGLTKSGQNVVSGSTCGRHDGGVSSEYAILNRLLSKCLGRTTVPKRDTRIGCDRKISIEISVVRRQTHRMMCSCTGYLLIEV